MDLENALYSGVQIAHNFGAAAVAGLPVAALWLRPAAPVARRMAALTLFAWAVQAASGAGFGTVSYFEEGELPQIHHLALAALCIKIFCAITAILLLSLYFRRRREGAPSAALWRGLAGLGTTALTFAAILRWFS